MSLYLLLFCKLLMVTTRSCRTGACLCLVIPVFFFKSWKLPSLGEYRERNFLYRNKIHGKLLPGRRNDQFSFDLKQQRGKLGPISFSNQLQMSWKYSATVWDWRNGKLRQISFSNCKYSANTIFRMSKQKPETNILFCLQIVLVFFLPCCACFGKNGDSFQQLIGFQFYNNEIVMVLSKISLITTLWDKKR